MALNHRNREQVIARSRLCLYFGIPTLKRRGENAKALNQRLWAEIGLRLAEETGRAAPARSRGRPPKTVDVGKLTTDRRILVATREMVAAYGGSFNAHMQWFIDKAVQIGLLPVAARRTHATRIKRLAQREEQARLLAEQRPKPSIGSGTINRAIRSL